MVDFQALNFAATKLASLSLLAVAAYALGAMLTRRTVRVSAPESVAFACAIGLGTLGMIVFALGLAGLLYPSVFAVGFVVVVAAAWPVWVSDGARLRGWWRGASPRRRATTIGVVCAVAIGVVVLSRIALYPPVDWDAAMYHVTVAKAFARDHGVPVLPYARYPVFPQLMHMPFTVMYAVCGEVGVHLVSYLCVMITALLVYGWGARAFGRPVGIVATALWLSSPVALWLGSNGYIDGGLTMFVTTAIYCLWRWRDEAAPRMLVFSAVACGFAVGTKYSGLIVVAILGLTTLFFAWRDRRLAWPFVFGLVTLAVFAPWFVRNYCHSGDPMFPFLGKYFGVQLWEPGDFASIQADMAAPGAGKGVAALAWLPWRLAFDDSVFRKAGPINPAAVLLLPLILAVGLALRRTRLLAFAATAFTLAWFASFQQQRYLLPILPTVGLLTAFCAYGVTRFASVLRTPHASRLVTAFALGLVAWGAFDAFRRMRDTIGERQINAVFWGKQRSPSGRLWRSAPLGPPPATEAARSAFLRARRNEYPCIELLNERFGSDYTVCTVMAEPVACFADGRFIGDRFGPVSYRRTMERMAAGSKALHAYLNELGAGFLLIGMTEVSVPYDEDFDRYFEPLCARYGARLFRVHDAPIPERPVRQSIINPGIEPRGDGTVNGWVLRSEGRRWPTIAPGEGIGGTAAVRVRRRMEVIAQAVAISPDAPAYVRFRARVVGGESATVVFLGRFHSPGGEPTQPEYRSFTIEGDWREYRFAISAFPHETHVVLSFGSGPHWDLTPSQEAGDATVYVDDVRCEQPRSTP